jgi:vancomycin permeability regulator SanA
MIGEAEGGGEGEGEGESGVEGGTDAPAIDGPDAEPRSWWRRRWVWRSAAAGAAVAVIGVGLLVAANIMVLVEGTPRYDTVAQVPAAPVAIVFGAGLDGTRPSPALEDRLDAAVALYRAHKVPHLLVTGDNSRTSYDEPTAMRTYLVAHGVPAGAITRDDAGFDTFDSCARARTIFGVRRAVLVTQDYHLARALYLCQHLGIRSVGLSVPDWQHHPSQAGFRYPLKMQVSFTGREWLARLKAVWDTDVAHRTPDIGGPYLGLASN